MPFVPASDFGFSDYLANPLTQHPWRAGLLIPQGLSLFGLLVSWKSEQPVALQGLASPGLAWLCTHLLVLTWVWSLMLDRFN